MKNILISLTQEEYLELLDMLDKYWIVYGSASSYYQYKLFQKIRSYYDSSEF